MLVRGRGNRVCRKNKDEDNYEEVASYDDEHSENDTDEESAQEAADAEQDFFASNRWNEIYQNICQNT